MPCREWRAEQTALAVSRDENGIGNLALLRIDVLLRIASGCYALSLRPESAFLLGQENVFNLDDNSIALIEIDGLHGQFHGNSGIPI